MSGFSQVSKEIFRLGYEISPIILTGESQVTRLMPMGILPIIALTEGINFVRGLLQGAENLALDDFFGHFQPASGGTLIENQVGVYPFANQTVAANAVITQPNHVSLRMSCPARGRGAYLTKLATMTALRATLNLHNTTGGTYIVATPAYIYTSCVMTGLRDVSQGQTKQVQMEWQFDFMQPLLTLSAAEGAFNNLLQKLNLGLPTEGALSGFGITPGNVLSQALSAIAPMAENLIGAGAFGGGAAAGLQSVTQGMGGL
jgi:hypothetical protein